MRWFTRHIHIYIHSENEDLIIKKLNQIMATQKELADQLAALKLQVDKSKAEVIAKIAALEQAIIDAGNTTPEVDAALADLKASVQAEDDVIPDA